MTKENDKAVLSKFYEKGIIYLSLVIISILAVHSLFFICRFRWVDEEHLAEVIFYDRNHTFAILVCMGILCVIIFKFQVYDLFSTRILTIAFYLYVISFSFFWIILSNPIPIADSLSVVNAAREISHGDYSRLLEGGYLYIYPNNVGITSLLVILYRMIGENYILGYRIVNILAVLVFYHIMLLLTDRLFSNESVIRLTILIFWLFPVPLFYVTFVYGNTLGLLFSTLVLYCTVLYIESEKVVFYILSLLFGALSYVIKSNYFIPLIAVFISLGIHFIHNKKYLNLPLLLPIFLAPTLLQKMIFLYYEDMTGVMLTGAPKVLWVAMGMGKGPFADGWYSNYFFDMYNAASDMDEASRIGWDSIRNSVWYYLHYPKEAIIFYYHKIISQWNEPSFEALWVNYHQPEQRLELFGSFLESIYKGLLNKLISFEMNLIHLFILGFSAIYLFLERKNIDAKQCLLLLVFIGGFFFHILWEGKSQYTWTYFVYLIPYSAYGTYVLSIMKG